MLLFALFLVVPNYCTGQQVPINSCSLPQYQALWPVPQSLSCGDQNFVVDPDVFHFIATSRFARDETTADEILQKAFDRYFDLIFHSRADCGDCLWGHELDRMKEGGGCNVPSVKQCVCEELGATDCCATQWTHTCAQLAIHDCSCRQKHAPSASPFREDDKNPKGFITALYVQVLNSDDDLQLETDEAYSLLIDANGMANLTANTVFGAMWGLETFSQLISESHTSRDSIFEIGNCPWEIDDFPRFPHRGLMIDSARNYLSKAQILHTIDALSYSRMNVLHWHIVEDQSFPVISEFEPRLAQAGAYSPEQTYTLGDIREIVQHGREHGVRVIPEFDTPGHVYSWGLYDNFTRTIDCRGRHSGILRVSEPELYELLEGLFAEMGQVFTDNFFHIGADEVLYGCWMSDERIQNWMVEMNFSTNLEVFQHFEEWEHTFLHGIGKTPVNWEEVFTDHVTLDPGSVVQVWRSHSTFARVLEAGYRGILSNSDAWYLDCGQGHWFTTGGNTWCDPFKYWQKMYLNEPMSGVSVDAKVRDRALGGECCMWGEMTDDVNFDSKVWPRAAAVGERLWSPVNYTDLYNAAPRFLAHRDRLVARGVQASAETTGFCKQHIDRC